MVSYEDISNQRFGRLLALRYMKKSMWACRCDCGAITVVSVTHLREGLTRSCGCLRKETKRGKSAPKTHCKEGHTLTLENTYSLKSGYLACKECELERVRARRGSRTPKQRVYTVRPKPVRVPKTHCKQGHELSEENTYLLGTGYRVCKICERARVAAK